MHRAHAALALEDEVFRFPFQLRVHDDEDVVDTVHVPGVGHKNPPREADAVGDVQRKFEVSDGFEEGIRCFPRYHRSVVIVNLIKLHLGNGGVLKLTMTKYAGPPWQRFSQHYSLWRY